jgi:hypothetical protein
METVLGSCAWPLQTFAIAVPTYLPYTKV